MIDRDRLLVLPQYLAPQHALSRAIRWATRQPWSTRLIPAFCGRFKVDLSEAARPLEDYRSFNDFFTRRLKDGARPIANGAGVLACPADGAVSQLGSVVDSQLLQAARNVPYLYARNERLVLLGKTPFGPAAMVLVGAMLVGSMSIEGFELEPLAEAATRMEKRTLSPPLAYAQGEEVGRFNMGSTVILVLPPGAPAWPAELAPGASVRMGARLAGS